MGVKNTKLGGTDWVDGNILYAADLNDTNDEILEAGTQGSAQNANKTLKAAGAYENGGVTAAENYTVAAGINGTVDTVNSTCTFNTNGYVLGISINGPTETSDTQTQNTSAFSNITVNMSALDSGVFSKITFGSETSAPYTISVKKNGNNIAYKTGTSVDGLNTVNFIGTDYTDIFENGDSIQIVFTGTSLNRITSSNSFTGSYFSWSSQQPQTGENYTLTEPYIFSLATKNSTGVVIIDTNTITLDGTEKAIQIYSDQETPTDTNITVDISDGTSTLVSDATVDSNGFTGVQALSGVVSGDLELTFNLATTDTTVTPKQYGWGVTLIR